MEYTTTANGDIGDDEKARVVYYEFDTEETKLNDTTSKYIHSYNLFKSLKPMVYTIKLAKIDTFSIYHSTDNSIETSVYINWKKQRSYDPSIIYKLISFTYLIPTHYVG